MRTQRSKVHEAGESDSPEVRGVDDIATVELAEPALDAWMSERGIERMAYQKPIS